MKEIAGILDPTVYKLVVTRLIPGATAIISYLWFAASKQANLGTLWATYKFEIVLAVTFMALVAGLVIDELGLLLESCHFKHLKKHPAKPYEGADLSQEWYLYLRTAFPDTAGRSVVKDLVLILKFELNMGIGLLLGAPGLLLFNISIHLQIGAFFGLLLLAAFLGGYSAKSSVDYLAQIRHEMLKGVR